MLNNIKNIKASVQFINRRGLASIRDLKVNQNINGFKVDEIRSIEDLNLTAIKLTHEKSGAQHLHIDKNDNNNVFSIGFQTLPSSSNGIAHILEHTTLCGSKKYPIRDPFFKMLNRSLATYMNAWTAHDFTNYPFASMNQKDFYNLMSVYLDATLDPLLLKSDFLQEGWRLERENTNDENSDWIIKGVVYNEMKGAMSDPSSLFYYLHQSYLYSGTTYEYNSGGDPSVIPQLTHQDLVNFHKKCYSPENSKTFTYGNFPLDKHLTILNDKFTSNIQDRDINKTDFSSVINKEPIWTGPKKVIVRGPVDHMTPIERQNKISVSFLTNKMNDPFEAISMSLLSSLLTNGASSPMQIALLDSNLGAEYSPTTGYNNHSMKTSFSIGLLGVKEEDLEKVENTITQVLINTAKDGFTARQIESALLPIELAFKHRTANFGIGIVQSLFSSWMFGNNPIDNLEITKIIQRLRDGIQKGRFFEKLIEKYLLNNPQKLIFIMKPDENFQTELEKKEKRLIEDKKKELIKSKSDEAELFKVGIELEKRQMANEDLSCLPSLQIEDINKEGIFYDIEKGENNTYWRTTHTNGISYLNIFLPIQNVSEHLRHYIPLFCDCLTHLGTISRSMQEIDEDIRLSTGGISFSPHVQTLVHDVNEYEEGILISCNALDSKIDEMYKLIQLLISETDFDKKDRLWSLILGNASSLGNSVADSGHSYAASYAKGLFSSSMAINEIYSGMTQVKFLNSIAQNEDLTLVVQSLKELKNILFNKNKMRTLVISEEAVQEKHKVRLDELSKVLDSHKDLAQKSSILLPSSSLANWFQMPFNSYYSSLAMKGVSFNHPDSAGTQILSTLISNLYLHREIREKGGAYGGGAGFDSMSGILSFYSYRDPTPLKHTEDTYLNSLRWAAKNEFTDRELKEAKLSVFKSIDKPRSASQEGVSYFLSGIEKEILQRRREKFLSTNSKEINRLASVLLENKKISKVIIGDSNTSNVKDDLKNWNLL